MSRKRPLSKLDALTEEQREMILDLSEGTNGQQKHTLAQLIAHLRKAFDVEMSDTRLSAWLARQRDAREFEALLGDVHDATTRANEIVGTVAKTAPLNQGNVALLSAALQAALLRKDPAAQERCAKLLSLVLAAHNGEKKADAAQDSARAARLRAEAQFPETFMKWLADRDAMKIARAPNMSHAEKIAKLRERFFADVDAMDKSGEVALP